MNLFSEAFAADTSVIWITLKQEKSATNTQKYVKTFGYDCLRKMQNITSVFVYLSVTDLPQKECE